MKDIDLLSLKNRYHIVGFNEALDTALNTAIQVAPTDLSVLIQGESGVGKEIIPRIIHKNSSEIIEYMESLRKDVIDDYYSDFMNFSGIRRSCLTVFTNIKENKNGSFTQYIYDDAEEYRSYPFGEVRKLTLDDYLYLERFGDVQVLVWGRFETKELSSLSDLLEG